MCVEHSHCAVLSATPACQGRRRYAARKSASREVTSVITAQCSTAQWLMGKTWIDAREECAGEHWTRALGKCSSYQGNLLEVLMEDEGKNRSCFAACEYVELVRWPLSAWPGPAPSGCHLFGPLSWCLPCFPKVREGVLRICFIHKSFCLSSCVWAQKLHLSGWCTQGAYTAVLCKHRLCSSPLLCVLWTFYLTLVPLK